MSVKLDPVLNSIVDTMLTMKPECTSTCIRGLVMTSHKRRRLCTSIVLGHLAMTLKIVENSEIQYAIKERETHKKKSALVTGRVTERHWSQE
ncbi:hypothetical protein TELCIR_10188 [Teladorsagia circumcincta]|uniref:Uncharacterized protein n=1 Tax=Teladorsagia circumcincta TaxID=45464 RepID=A0A2G9UCZ7_TELCI|nr:hypothetical protein TELCIR_10188 [Teladorsagia circumcincta]